MDRALRILMLEDNPNDVVLTRRELERAAVEVELRVVVDREPFLRELEVFSPDIVISDYNLPTFDGGDALRLVQEHCQGTPVVFVTGELEDERAVELLQAGADDYVLKDQNS